MQWCEKLSNQHKTQRQNSSRDTDLPDFIRWLPALSRFPGILPLQGLPSGPMISPMVAYIGCISLSFDSS